MSETEKKVQIEYDQMYMDETKKDQFENRNIPFLTNRLTLPKASM